VTVLDLEAAYKVDPERFKSKSRNSPFRGWELRGRVTQTIVGGIVVHEEVARG
jgi:dihydroorotase